MQHHLHHRELVEVGVEQRRDDHAGAGADALSRRRRSAGGRRNVTRLPATRPTSAVARLRSARRRVRPGVDDADPARRATGRRACSRPTASRRRRKCVSVPSGARPMMRPAASDATPDASCCSDALKLMKLPRSLGSTLPVTSAVAGPNRPGTKTKKSTDSATTQASGSGGRWVVNEDRPDRDQREDREQALLAVAIGEPADHLRRDERGRAAGEIDHREIRLGDADIGDVVGGDERDDREHRAHQHDHEGERAPVVGHAEDGPQLLHRAAARARARRARPAAE